MRFLKILSPYISSLLSQIITKSFHSDTFPKKLLHAKVIPLLKKGCLRPYSEYFSRGVANRTPSPFQACDGVQLQINIKNMSTGSFT